MKICLISNFSDTHCGFRNYSDQTAIALRRAGHQVTVWDGTYSAVYARQQRGAPFLGMFPPDVDTYDVVHTIWHAMTLNHYAGAPWEAVHHPIRSWIDGGPSNASCPFKAQMDVRWGHYPRPPEEQYHVTPLPIVDWITDLPAPDPIFTVGATSVRGDGLGEIRAVCAANAWATNLPDGQWRPVEDEIRRLARSSVNVCWYNTPPLWRDMAGAPSTALASHRPLLISRDALLWHLWDRPDLYHGQVARKGACRSSLEDDLILLSAQFHQGTLRRPQQVLQDFSWTSVAVDFTRVWEGSRSGR